MRRIHLPSLTWYTSLLFGEVIAWYLTTTKPDPDLWWRLRHGSDLLAQGFTQGDPYSYTMPSFPFVSHAWSLDILFSLLNSWGGYALLTMVVVFVTTTLIAVLTAKHSESYLGTIAVLIFWGGTLGSMGVRVQVMAWPLLCFALWLCFLRDTDWQRWRWVLPPLALFWANVHGSIPILFLLIGVKILIDATKRSIDYKDLLLVAVSLALTLLNPYGIGLWREIWLTNSDNTLRSTIAEWQPIWTRTTGVLLLVSLAAGATIAMSLVKRHLLATGLLLVTLVLAVMSVRHIPLFICTAVISLLYLAPQFSIQPLFRDFKTDQTLRYLVRGIIGIASLILIWTPLDPVVYGTSSIYPVESLSYIRTNYPNAVILNHYNWGGYLIYERPEGKVFVDGRMPSWHHEAPEGELDWAHKTWREIGRGNRHVFDEAVATYGIDTVLWLKPSTLSIDFFTMLKDAGWEPVHVDENAVVYRAPASLERSPAP